MQCNYQQFSLFIVSVIVSFTVVQCGSTQVAELELGVLPKVAFIASLIQRKDRHLLRLFSSHFQQLFYFGSGLSILSSNQSFHLWYVFAGISPRLSLAAGFSQKIPHEGYFKKITIGRHHLNVSLAVFFLPLGIKIDTGHFCVFFWSLSCEQNQIGETLNSLSVHNWPLMKIKPFLSFLILAKRRCGRGSSSLHSSFLKSELT